MATILDKDLTRETTIKVDEREIQITLTEKQSVSLKLKGMKSGALEIGIGELYSKLKGESPQVSSTPVKTDSAGRVNLSSFDSGSEYLVSLQDIRSALLVDGFDLEATSKFEGFMVRLINERKTRFENKNKR